MATLDDVRRLALALPETSEDSSRAGQLSWRVKSKLFVWERPLRKVDIEALGDAAPAGTILGVRVPDEGVKHALVASDPDVYFTTPHFDGYPAVLVKLETVELSELEEIVVEAWLNRAPRKLADAYVAGGTTGGPDTTGADTDAARAAD
jgi:hypothetical protein